MEEKKLKILLLEDNPDDVKLIDRVLKKDNLSFISQCVDTREEFDNAIRNFRPDVVLSDHGLPQFNSREALKICLKERAFIPFILVTGTMSDEFAISILRDGADDYILKSNLSRLPLAIRRAVKERRLEKLKREARHALRKQNTELLKVNQELDKFVYSVSHNLKGPLASVRGLLNIVNTMDRDPALKDIHAMMDAGVSQLDKTLNEIIEYSKNARSEIQCTQIEWRDLINGVLTDLKYLDPDDNVDKIIECHLAGQFISDAARLRVLFSNVLSNALQFTQSGRPAFVRITISGTSESASVVFADNGIGIQPDVLPKVCDMFYRGTERSKGAGLGLYIVKEVVSKLRGQLHIQAVPGEGTTVTVTIPNASSAFLSSSVVLD